MRKPPFKYTEMKFMHKSKWRLMNQVVNKHHVWSFSMNKEFIVT